jgi:hypothetical protein
VYIGIIGMDLGINWKKSLLTKPYYVGLWENRKCNIFYYSFLPLYLDFLHFPLSPPVLDVNENYTNT